MSARPAVFATFAGPVRSFQALPRDDIETIVVKPGSLPPDGVALDVVGGHDQISQRGVVHSDLPGRESLDTLWLPDLFIPMAAVSKENGD
jgi:hypothetical protein